MVDHFVSLDLGLWGKDWLGHELVGQLHDGFSAGAKLATDRGGVGGKSILKMRKTSFKDGTSFVIID